MSPVPKRARSNERRAGPRAAGSSHDGWAGRKTKNGEPLLPWSRLLAAARRARACAYAPYSRFAVGAALLARDGTIFTGANVENASFGLTICAERAAVVAAVTAGRREFRALALVAGRGEPASPCGACRQVLHEFAPDLPIRLASADGCTRDVLLCDLLPLGFAHGDLKRR